MQLEFGVPPSPRSRVRGRAGAERARRTRTTRELMQRLHCDAHRLCVAFSLRYRTLEAERAGVRSRYGACFSDGTIKIRLYHATTGRPLKYSSLIDTLCHELAHLRHFNHGARFRDLYQRILAHARREGIYRPAPAVGAEGGRGWTAPARRRGSPARVVGVDQLSLFG